jgi:hypothetical protein
VVEFAKSAKLAFALSLVGALWAGAADASSFVELKPLAGNVSPSVLVLGAPPPSGDPNLAIGRVDPAPHHRQDPADSAIVTISPSVIALGEPDLSDQQIAMGEVDRAPHRRLDPADSEIITVSPSVIAMGEPAVVDEKVAAIDDKPHNVPPPMVIRGGMIGDAFSPATAAPPASQPSDAEASAASPSSDHPRKPSEPQPQQDDPPAATPPRAFQKPQ